MKVFNVLKPGLFTTLQDMGRYGYLRYGVPISGAMDTFSLVTANLLVGNNPNDACLEITLTGPELQVLARTQIAITGGSISPKVNDQDVPMWQTLEVKEGDIISFGKMESGCRAYLAVRGGINTPIILGSRSTYVRGRFGGINGRELKAGDVIEGFSLPPIEHTYSLPKELIPKFTSPFTAHVIPGPQKSMFTKKGVNTFFSSQYRVTVESDRMGYRLEGPKIEHKEKGEIVSDALLPGAIQVPKDGQPIIVMRDAQTTGGYPKIAAVITPDVSLLGQARPNDVIIFSEISISQAREKFVKFQKLLSNLRKFLRKSGTFKS